MNIKTLLNALLIFSGFGISASASNIVVVNQGAVINQRIVISRGPNCTTEYLTLVSQSRHLTKSCRVTKPLRLVNSSFHYPLMDSDSRPVEKWEGQVSKTFAIESHYLRELVDDCRGRVLSSMPLADTTTQNVDFEIANPNLDANISQSFEISPMSARQAEIAFAKTARACRTR